jgi:N-acetylglucosaminyldiphosphoundecaprenol N-acetyl-beta-D-mannosaminyltransferase
MLNKLILFDTYFDNITRRNACDIIEEYIQKKNKVYIVGVKDVALTVRSLENNFLLKFYNSIDMLLVDGRGLYWASKIVGSGSKKFVELVGAPELYEDLLLLASARKYSVYFIGAHQNVLEDAVKNIQLRHNDINIIGYHHGYIDEQNIDEVIDSLHHTKPDMVFLGMGTPFRENFMSQYLERIPNTTVVLIGGLLDVEGGLVQRAPGVVTRMGLEWLYRVLQEPKRLYKRYLHTHSKFFYYIIRELAKNSAAKISR